MACCILTFAVKAPILKERQSGDRIAMVFFNLLVYTLPTHLPILATLT
jgi:hypothetical protein